MINKLKNLDFDQRITLLMTTYSIVVITICMALLVYILNLK